MESRQRYLSSIRAALQPSKWRASYEELVTKNVQTVGQIESALRSLTYIIPGKAGWLARCALSTR